jgi:hypothetical protein
MQITRNVIKDDQKALYREMVIYSNNKELLQCSRFRVCCIRYKTTKAC